MAAKPDRERQLENQLAEVLAANNDRERQLENQLAEVLAANKALQEVIEKLEARVKELEGQIAKNSRNSSKPPSSDGPKKKKKSRSLRPKGKRKPGGQYGHQGKTLEQTDEPTRVVVHPVAECSECHSDLSEKPATRVEKRQVFDLPPPPGLESTEHQAERKECDQCGHKNRAAFPEGVNAPVQYGPHIKAFASYLREYQLLPSQRTCELLWDLHGCRISEGTLANILASLHDLVEEPVAQIAQALQAESVANFDETGCSVNGKRNWLHVACTERLTHYQIHAKRGTEATDEIGILPKFSGRAIHDHWKPYFTYTECKHGLCNAHHLRELVFVYEEHQQAWAQQMIDCLLAIKNEVDQCRNIVDHLDEFKIRTFEALYQEVLDEGYLENPLPEKGPSEPKKRGRPKKTKPRNLLERLDTYRTETLAFMYDFEVPFDNNQAERDIRMTKVQQKISGTFRTGAGADAFCRIRSYISTAKKNAVNVLDAIRGAFLGEPYSPSG